MRMDIHVSITMYKKYLKTFTDVLMGSQPTNDLHDHILQKFLSGRGSNPC